MLTLRENKIRELPKGIGNLVHLSTFDISHNHLEHLPEGRSIQCSAFITHLIITTWVKVFRIIPEFRILRLTL